MSSASVTGPASLDELENDLPSIAAQAALELDHLSLGRPIGFSATQRLVELISHAVTDVPEPTSPSSLLNPSTAVALGKAIDETLYAGQARTSRLPELIKQAGRFKDRLAAVVQDPSAATAAEKEELRNVCVALSRQAVAVESITRRYRRDHPFKKYL
jgi:hypothetical protein